MTDLAPADDYVEAHFDDCLDDLFELLSQPSISATGEGVAECTTLVEELCRTYGFDESTVVETAGQPSIIAHAYAENPDMRPTILIYGHYDVQPVDPDAWTTPPFKPTIRDGPNGEPRVYARGAGDNKGQWFSHVCAVQALCETTGLPMNITLLLEGEEESGSPNLESVVTEHANELDAELAYVADGPIDPSGRPHVLMGARGMVYVQIDAQGPNRDLHSGNYGGPIPNPAWELINLLASMKDESERVTIDGYYDDVRLIENLDHETLAAMPFDAEMVKGDLDINEFADGPGESYLEKLLYYPTLNVAGFSSGYGGEGTKTIIPSTATVKIDMRLVDDQDPDDILEKFVRHVKKHQSEVVNVEITHHGSMAPQRTPLDSPITNPIMDAVSDAWGTDPILKPSLGGSLPTYLFADVLDLPCVVVPYANSDEDNHSPDENLELGCFKNGIRTTLRVLANLSESESADE